MQQKVNQCDHRPTTLSTNKHAIFTGQSNWCETKDYHYHSTEFIINISKQLYQRLQTRQTCQTFANADKNFTLYIR